MRPAVRSRPGPPAQAPPGGPRPAPGRCPGPEREAVIPLCRVGASLPPPGPGGGAEPAGRAGPAAAGLTAGRTSGGTPGVLGPHFGKAHVLSWRIILGTRGARPRPPAPLPGDAPLLSPPPPHWLPEPDSGGRTSGGTPGVLGPHFGKTRSNVLENRLGNPGRPAPPPRAAPPRCPLTFPAPPHWLREPDSGGRSLQAVCLGTGVWGPPFLVWGTSAVFCLGTEPRF